MIIKKKRQPSFYLPYVRRYGKFKPIGRPTTLERAREAGARYTLSTLGASFQVREARTGKKIPIAKETRLFRPGGRKKQDLFTVVQKAPGRLSSTGERREIISSRNTGRIKFFK